MGFWLTIFWLPGSRGAPVIIGTSTSNSGRPMVTVPAPYVPEELISQAQVVLQGKSRNLIIRELQVCFYHITCFLNQKLTNAGNIFKTEKKQHKSCQVFFSNKMFKFYMFSFCSEIFKRFQHFWILVSCLIFAHKVIADMVCNWISVNLIHYF